ncbi:RhuM family protein [Pedobacter sp. PWIIR3]
MQIEQIMIYHTPDWVTAIDVKLENETVWLSVGYRVSFKKGTQFRIWVNKILKDYLIRGYSVNEKCLKKQIRQLGKLLYTLFANKYTFIYF